MKTAIIGGGPAGLWFSILAKKQDPTHDITIHERNRPGETFGWGVVFSDQTLGNLEAADPESFAEIRRNFAYWTDIDVFLGDQHVRSTGHGFCGLQRVVLLDILTRRARALGVEIVHDSEIVDVEALAAAHDLVLAAEGVNSAVRSRYEESFRPALDWRKCRFVWLGMEGALPAFTFLFRDTPHGLFQVHAYPFDADRSTFIVECREETWRASGLEGADEATTLAFIEHLFAKDLAGRKLLANRSIWRVFPTVRCGSWSHGNVVLMGDAVHTAHFSIGSGTKLAMESAMALVDALGNMPGVPIPAVLAAYEAARRPEVERLQAAAQTSLEWFENTNRYKHQDVLQFAFALMSRSKRITWDELATRDPALVQRVAHHWADQHAGSRPGATPAGVDPTTGRAPLAAVPLFTPLRLREVELPNRLVVSPMCQYSAVDGVVDDWHLVHLGSRAVGGAGLVIAEATAITSDARITPGCAGLWNDTQEVSWKRIVDFVHAHSPAQIGIQLAHAGRRARCNLPWVQGGDYLADTAPEADGWDLVAPSAIPWTEASPTPRALTRADMGALVAAWVEATLRADRAGFDLVEIHLAHGYLLDTFLSALTNTRDDVYGGPDLADRLRFPLEVVRAVRAAWPAHKPLSARISATEWAPGGHDDAERAAIARALTDAGVDVIDVSAGGTVAHGKPVYGRMFQAGFADQIRHESGVRTIAVGNIQNADQANTLLAAGRCDLVAMARPHLADPYMGLHAAARYEVEVPWPVQYLAAAPRRRKGS